MPDFRADFIRRCIVTHRSYSLRTSVGMIDFYLLEIFEVMLTIVVVTFAANEWHTFWQTASLLLIWTMNSASYYQSVASC
jgi:hypothetical protein